MNYTFPAIVSSIYLLLFIWSFQIIDSSLDDWVQLKELDALQVEARKEAAGQALCNAERGPNSEVRWTPDNQLVCTTRRGEVRPKGKMK